MTGNSKCMYSHLDGSSFFDHPTHVYQHRQKRQLGTEGRTMTVPKRCCQPCILPQKARLLLVARPWGLLSKFSLCNVPGTKDSSGAHPSHPRSSTDRARNFSQDGPSGAPLCDAISNRYCVWRIDIAMLADRASCGGGNSGRDRPFEVEWAVLERDMPASPLRLRSLR